MVLVRSVRVQMCHIGPVGSVSHTSCRTIPGPIPLMSPPPPPRSVGTIRCTLLLSLCDCSPLASSHVQLVASGGCCGQPRCCCVALCASVQMDHKMMPTCAAGVTVARYHRCTPIRLNMVWVARTFGVPRRLCSVAIILTLYKARPSKAEAPSLVYGDCVNVLV